MGSLNSNDKTHEKIINQLRGVVDPELGSDIVDLGMVKDVSLSEEGHLTSEGAIDVGTVQLTSEGCI